MSYYFHASYNVNNVLLGIKFPIYPLTKHEFSSIKLKDSNFIHLSEKGFIKVVKLGLNSCELCVERSEKKWVDPKTRVKVNGKKVNTGCLTKLPKEGHAQIVKFRKDNVELSAGIEKTSDEKKWVDPKTRDELDGCGNFRGKKVHTRCSRKWVNPKTQDKVHTRCLTKWELYGGCTPLILRALENVSDLDEAFKPWEGRLSKKEITVILKEQVNWERAMEIFEWFKTKGCYELNVIHYNIMFKILGKAQKWGELEKLWDEMRNKKITPINSSYGTVIDVFSKGGHKKEALVWLQKMNEQGLEVDEVTMGTVVQMYKKLCEFKKAEEYFKMWSFRKSWTSRGTRFCLSLNTYNNLIDTYGKAGKLQEMVSSFKDMVRNQIIPDIVTFNTMIHVYANLGMLEQVNELMQMIEELKRTPDTRTFGILVSLYAKRGDIGLAYSYFTKIKECGLKPDPVSYRVLLRAYCIRQMVVEAEMIVSEMDENGVDIDEYTQSTVTRMYIDSNMLDKSETWFERFHLKGNMSSECYSANIDAYGERGYIDLGEKVFLCCQKREKTGVVEFNVMLKAYGISKKFDKACKLFDSMEKYGILPDKCSYISLIQPLASADLPHVAKPYLMKMQEVGLVDDCVPYTAVISSFAKLGQMDLSKKLYSEMIRHGVKPDVILYGVIINASVESGNVIEVRRYVNDLRKAGFSLNEVICNSLIKLYTKVGHLEEAEETYKLLQSFETGVNVYSSNCMIDLYSERSLVVEAEEVFRDLIRRGEANEFSYAMMLCMYRKIGEIEEALKIAGKMQELGLLTEILSYNNVLALFAADGKFKAVVDLFNEMIEVEDKLDDYTFKSLGLVLMKSGVSKQTVARLEVARKKDGLNGLLAWLSALTSVVNGENYGDQSTKPSYV